ncbi:hypothetical protein [Bradyrhizobium sp. SYSU BS000235]|uniref:hypothetical protein n=1 Tax=Bradyrhizobium sp. SYSU BS000235 TaxID=3411332 RepID=UPI003C7958A0
MTPDKVDELTERVAWLERKMVRILWLLISVTSALVGLMVAYVVDNSFGWLSVLVAVVIWLTAGLILQRQEFKGAPKQVQFIDP